MGVISKPVGCLLKIVITIVVIVALIGGAVLVVLNLTPAKLGLADTEIYEGQTLRTMGLADAKLLDIIKFIKSFETVNEDDIVKNKPNAEADGLAAKNNTQGSSIPVDGETGEPDYSAILSGEVTYDAHYRISYNDTTLAYIFSEIVSKANDEASADDSLKYLADLGADFEEITIAKLPDGKAELRLVASINLSSIKAEVENALGPLGSIINIPEKVYLVSYQTIEVESVGTEEIKAGVIKCTSKELRINDQNNAVASAIFAVLAAKASDESEENTGNNVDTVNGKIGEGFSSFVSNLGKVGTADVAEDGKTVTGNTVYGNDGMSDHVLTLITNVALP